MCTRDERDEGFTLIELLMSIMLLGILIGAIVAALIVSLNSLAGRQQSVTDSTGAQLLTSYLVTDAQSADDVDPANLSPGNPNAFTCDDGSPTRVLLELRWTDADGTTGTTDVVYKIEPTSATDYRLVRDVYTVDAATASCGSGPVDETIVAPNVSNAAADTTAVCDGGSNCDNSATSVGLHVTAFSSEPKSGSYAPYVFDVTGTRRVS